MTTWVILASGPSLSRTDIDITRGKALVIAVNDAYKLAPWADILYASDRAWWDLHADALVSFRGQRYTHDLNNRTWTTTMARRGMNIVHGLNLDGVSTQPGEIHLGANSGFQALNLAITMGATKIILTGFDMIAHDGKTHFFGDHPKPLRNDSPYPLFRQAFNKAAPQIAALDIDVVNCTRRTALQCFRKSTMRDELP